MTICDAMTARAFAEFDAMLAEQEKITRSAMRAAGCRKADIDAHIADCHARLAEQRALIPGNVVIELMKQHIPLDAPADVWSPRTAISEPHQ